MVVEIKRANSVGIAATKSHQPTQKVLVEKLRYPLDLTINKI